MSQQTFSLEAFIFVIILIIYVVASHLIEIKKVPYLHESAIAIFMGMLTAIFAKYVLFHPIKFSNEVFFAIILPPIIFSAGYSLRKSLFFQNFGMTCYLGVLGTIIGFVLMTVLLSLVNKLIFNSLNLTQIMMITSVLCATDTVAAMSLIKADKYPVLNAVLFGEGIINDAVAIILFRTVSQLDIGEGQFAIREIIQMIFNFCYLFFFSLALGIVTGFGLSYLFKINQSFMKFPIKQTSLILLNGYFTYLIGQLLGLSGIISLFTCAIIMGHYSFMNISEQSQRGTGLAFQTVSYMAQAFVFAYLGASIFGIQGNLLAIGMGFAILVMLPFIRAIMVYLLPLMYHILRKPFPMSNKQLKICWYSGMVRGVIAFALCLQIPKQNKGDFIVTVTLVIVMITTVVGAMMLKSFSKCIGMDENNEQENEEENYDHMKQQKNNDQLPSSRYHNIGGIAGDVAKQNNIKASQQNENGQSKKSKKFEWLENEYIKPIFSKKSTQKQIIQLQQRQKYKQDQI